MVTSLAASLVIEDYDTYAIAWREQTRGVSRFESEARLSAFAVTDIGEVRRP
jgi:hypothetical protein